MAPHSSTFTWKIPWMEEPGRLQSIGLLRVRHNWAISLSLFTFHALEREMATHSSVLAWRIPGTGEPSGLPSVGSHRVGHDWSDLAAAAAAAASTIYVITLQHFQHCLILSLSMTISICVRRYIHMVGFLQNSSESSFMFVLVSFWWCHSCLSVCIISISSW